jgi:methoxymalonate biosynthesis acyl carrier protein
MMQPTTADRADLERRICALFLEALNIRVDSDDTDLIESGVIDSLVLVELLLHLEEAFDVEVVVTELEIEDFRTVKRIAMLVSRQRAGEGIP